MLRGTSHGVEQETAECDQGQHRKLFRSGAAATGCGIAKPIDGYENEEVRRGRSADPSADTDPQGAQAKLQGVDGLFEFQPGLGVHDAFANFSPSSF